MEIIAVVKMRMAIKWKEMNELKIQSLPLLPTGLHCLPMNGSDKLTGLRLNAYLDDWILQAQGISILTEEFSLIEKGK